MTSEDINTIIKYSKSIIGIPYTWWLEGDTTYENLYPFYITKLPTKAYLKKHGVNCTGFINLLRLKLGKDIKGNGKYIGGTGQWFKYFKDYNLLKQFDYNKKYPLGTLFIREYRNAKDQGHVAILYSYNKKEKLKDKILHANIIHAYAEGDYPIGKGKVGITNLGYSHFINSDGFYNNVVLPHDWLN